MPFQSLRGRLLVVQSALVVGLTALTLAFVSVRANRAVDERIDADLARSRDRITAAEADRFHRLEFVARLVASFPDVTSLFATDAATMRDFLSEFRQRHNREELLFALNPAGEVVARTDTFAPLTIPDLANRWIQPALAGQTAAGEVAIEGRMHEATLVVSEVGGTVFGFIMSALPVDDEVARALREVSDKEIVILSPDGVAGSTLAAQRLPWKSTRELPADANGHVLRGVDIGGEQFEGVIVPPARGRALRIVSLQSRDRALAPYRSIQYGLLALGALAALAGIAGSAVLARSLTAPIGGLVAATRQVAEGTFDVSLDVQRTDEIGHLARSFKLMTDGLRERADMQKFMSQSTVQMIQSGPPAERREGARRTLTLLFCDIRNFTQFSEPRAPEEAVAVLNRYLRLEATLVQRYRGDVDKFIGDAVFAHFAGPDMALDAIRCAIEIHRAIDAATAGDASLPPLAVGIGIATGEVIVGSIGSDQRLDYTAIGPAVNLSARLCASADAREILLSEQTFDLVRDLIAAEPVPPLVVKGFTTPVRAYRIIVRPQDATARHLSV